MILRVNRLALYISLLVVGVLIVPFSSQAATLVLDPTFSMGAGFNNRVDTLTVQDDGKLLVGGVFTTYNGSSSPGLVRINVDGTKDSGFNVGGGFTLGGGALTITPRSDNRLLVEAASHHLTGAQLRAFCFLILTAHLIEPML